MNIQQSRTIVNQLIEELTMANVPIPFVAKAAFGIVKVRYWFWWIGSKKKLYTRYPGAFAGGFLFNLATNNEMLRTASKILLIIVRIEACVKELFKLCRECQDLWNSCKGRYHESTQTPWVTTSSWLSTSVRWKVHFLLDQFSFSVRRISFCALRILRRLDKLLMHSINTYESFYATNEAVNESLIHATRKIEQLFENKKAIYLALENHKPLIKRVLTACRLAQPEVKTEAIIASVKSTLDTGDDIFQGFQSVSETAGEIGKDFVKRTILGVFTALNISKHLPEWLLPEPGQIFATRLRANLPEECFPPIADITSKKPVNKMVIR